MPDDVAPSVDPMRELIEEEHRVLRETLARLDSIDDLRATVELLRELRTLLVPHFEREEAADGFPKVVGDANAHLMERLDHVFDEHRTMLNELDRLLELGFQTIDGPMRDVLDGAQRLVQRLEAHEIAETELLTDALYRDLGGG